MLFLTVPACIYGSTNVIISNDRVTNAVVQPSNMLSPVAYRSNFDNLEPEAEQQLTHIINLFFDITHHPTDLKHIERNINHIFYELTHIVLRVLDKTQTKTRSNFTKQAIQASTARIELDEQTTQRIATLISKKLIEHQDEQTVIKKSAIMNNPEKKQMILSRVALMIENFVGILKNRHDKEKIITNVADMFGHALHIAAHATKK